MAKREKKTEEGPPGPGEWIVTFSDCMTLLLCFFVLLLTFSSFDEVELQKLAGAFPTDSHTQIFPIPRDRKESSVQPPERVKDTTEKGSETATKNERKPAKNPLQRSPIIDSDALKDRKVLYIPSQWLFHARGSALTGEGRDYLALIAKFMRIIPSRVVISESGPREQASSNDLDGLQRAWAVMRFFTRDARLPAGRFNVTASVPAVPPRLRDSRVVAVTLIAGNVY